MTSPAARWCASWWGERPGLVTAESMSAYITYGPHTGIPESKRTVVSNIHRQGTPAVEAGAHIAQLLMKILEAKASGVDLLRGKCREAGHSVEVLSVHPPPDGTRPTQTPPPPAARGRPEGRPGPRPCPPTAMTSPISPWMRPPRLLPSGYPTPEAFTQGQQMPPPPGRGR